MTGAYGAQQVAVFQFKTLPSTLPASEAYCVLPNGHVCPRHDSA